MTSAMPSNSNVAPSKHLMCGSSGAVAGFEVLRMSDWGGGVAVNM